jgi:hypothetical protein
VRSTKYTRELLEPIVQSSHSLADVIRKLGLEPNGGNHRMISTRIRLAELDTSHFGANTIRARVDSLSKELLAGLVTRSLSIAAVLAQLDLPIEGRCHRELTRRLRELSIDTSHVQGQGWSRGFTRATHPSPETGVSKRSFSDEVVFVQNGPMVSGPNLIRRLLAKGALYRCAICGIDEWCGKRLVLHLDHVNGVHNDHRVENFDSSAPTAIRRRRRTATRLARCLRAIQRPTRAWRNWYPR